MRHFLAVGVWAIVASVTAVALSPHEVLVVANDRSANSVLLARMYMRLRSIPEGNLVRLEIPDAHYLDGNAVTPEEFTRLVWAPTQAAVEERGLGAQILAWVYSCDFPTRVLTEPAMSLTGMTFARNRLPGSEVIKSGSGVSPLFMGPRKELREDKEVEGSFRGSQTFDRARTQLLEGMPLPAMMLGYLQERGNTVDEMVALFERNAAVNGKGEKGDFYFVVSEDVRSTCRQWQFAGAAEAIRALGAEAHILSEAIAEGTRVHGYMEGASTVRPRRMTFAPGAFAEHLTSYAATFENASQTKMSEWLRAGATATAGTVTEPYAQWMKFPNAYVFVHQLKGCAMIEAVYQSVQCPYQLLIVGDPLAKPWGSVIPVEVAAPQSPVSGRAVQFSASADISDAVKFDWLVDGRVVGSGQTFLWDSQGVKDGAHRIRAVARTTGQVRHSGFHEVNVEVKNKK